MRVAPAVVLSESDKEWMLKQSRSAVAPKRLGERCKVILLAAEGKTNEEIAAELSITRQKAGRWRSRFVEKGRIGIEKDEPGRGRKLTYSVELRAKLVRKTTQAKPADATQWSRTSMAEAMAVSPSTVGRIWKEHGLKPHLEQTFKVSNDPHFAETNFVCFVHMEDRIPKSHPIREVKRLISAVFRRLDLEFDDLYSQAGRASIPPERLLGPKCSW